MIGLGTEERSDVGEIADCCDALFAMARTRCSAKHCVLSRMSGTAYCSRMDSIRIRRRGDGMADSQLVRIDNHGVEIV